VTRLSGYKKILLIASEFPPGPGGIGNHAYNLAKYLNLNDADVEVLTVSDFAEKNEEKEFDRKQKFRIIRFERYKSRVKTFFERIKIISAEIKKNNFTHIIFSGRFSLYASLFLGKFRKKIKFIAIAHGGDVNADNLLERKLIRKALMKMDLIVPVSNYSSGKLPLNLDFGKVVVIPNGFDFEEIENLKIESKSRINGELNLVSVGTVWPRKGHHNVLAALPEIISCFPETMYHIVGRHADLSKVKHYLENEKLKKYLNVHGGISNNEMQKVLSLSHIFILLSESQSTGDFEGFGIAVIEANHFGLPAIGAKGSGLEDSIDDGGSGILVDPHNKKEILDAVKKISDNYEEFSANAKLWAQKHHWSKIVKRYIEAIENIN